MNKNFYITTTLPYVNAKPHIGFAMEIIRADTIARYKTLMGYAVFFNTGVDEHGQKIAQAAHERGLDPQTYVNQLVGDFEQLKMLGLREDLHFIRTTDEHHIRAAQEMWRRCDQAGYIEKRNYQTKYCVGCELEKQDSELDPEGRCPLHPNRSLEFIDEENYFFRFSAFEKQLLSLYEKGLVVPEFRQHEIVSFVEQGLRDFPISRLRSKMAWGVPIPGDDEQVMYVWFDALTNYISTLGWPDRQDDFEAFWVQGTTVQYCGKDNLRQQSAMWQAMLLAAGLPTTHTIVVNGFINSDGQKMSKSLGNVIDPLELIEEYAHHTAYPEDVLRYYVLRHINSFEDSDMTREKLHEAYTANLVNGLGNLVSRLMNMVVNYEVEYEKNELWFSKDFADTSTPEKDEYFTDFETYQLQKVADGIWKDIGDLDQEITTKEPFKLFKTDPEQAQNDLAHMVYLLSRIASRLGPMMPRTAQKIKALILEKKKPETPLFARRETMLKK